MKAADDSEALATLMDAGAAMSADRCMNLSAVLASLAYLDALVVNMDDVHARLHVPACALLSAAHVLAGVSKLWCELPSSVETKVFGSGWKSFAKGPAGATRNVVFVQPCINGGLLAEYVTLDDVHLVLMSDSGSPVEADVSMEYVSDGVLKLAYVLAADCVRKMQLAVIVCGVTADPTVSVQQGYDAMTGVRLVASYDVVEDDEHPWGMAVNADGSMMSLSYTNLDQVHVFQLSPSFERVHVIGCRGDGPAEFNSPGGACFMPDNTVFVCDFGNNRVQRLSLAGDMINSFTVQAPESIAVHSDLIVVGNTAGWVEIHNAFTGELIRCFGSRGDGPGQIGTVATGVCVSPDGTNLLVAEYTNPRLSMFTVDGVFIKHIAVGILGNDSSNDVCFGAGGDIVVSDCEHHRIRVFASDTHSQVKMWGFHGSDAGQFTYPTALTVSGSYLYVLDDTRVQVFE